MSDTDSESGSGESVTIQAVELPVVFKYGGNTKTFDRQPEGKGGGGSIGVWKEGVQAWKIFSKTTVLEKNRAYYQTAKENKLPIGTPTPIFYEGTVTQGTNRSTQGYALVSQWLDGKEFNFHVSDGAFEQALKDQNISQSKSSTQYQKVLSACNIAFKVHLSDVQGKVNGADGANEPLAFFDINLASTYSGQAQTLVDVITAWGTKD